METSFFVKTAGGVFVVSAVTGMTDVGVPLCSRLQKCQCYMNNAIQLNLIPFIEHITKPLAFAFFPIYTRKYIS